jgi:hypothetical protein
MTFARCRWILRPLLLVLVAEACHARGLSHEELRRRVEFADGHFAAGKIPGSHTDRGRAYIALGAPDKIEDHPHDPAKGATFPWQEWTYRSVPRIGTNVRLVFVSPRMDNLYYFVPPSPEDAGARRTFVLIQRQIERIAP